MKPTTFNEKTKTLQKPQSMTDEECGPLDVYCDGEKCISCWKMSWRERISALIHGKVWVYVWTGLTQPPISLEIRKTVFMSERNDNEKSTT